MSNLRKISDRVGGTIEAANERIMTFLTSFNYVEDKKSSYSVIDRFLMRELGQESLLVFSLPEKEGKFHGRSPRYIRIFYNKRAAKNIYKLDDNLNLPDSFLKTYLSLEEGTFSFNHNNFTFHLFPIERKSGQIYFVMFAEKEVFKNDAQYIFKRFFINLGNNWKHLEELRSVENLVHIDDVTGLYNQRKLHKDLKEASKRYADFNENFSILFIDIDHFKKVNDGHGHLVGTQLLRSLGKLLKITLRDSDLIYRYGGDEFVMLLPDVPGETGEKIGLRILEAIKKHDFHVDLPQENEAEKIFKLTVSIGVATFPQDASNPGEILSIADQMMYEAKKGGRGRVCFTRDILPSDK